MKPGQVVGQSGRQAPQAKRQPRPLSDAPLDALAKAVYLTVPEAAAYVRCRSVKAFEAWASRARIPKGRRGRTVLYFRRDLDDAVAPPRVKPIHTRAS